MKYSASDSMHRHRRLSSRLSHGLKNLSLVLFGVGIGVGSTNWFTKVSPPSTPPAEPLSSAASPAPVPHPSPSTEAVENSTASGDSVDHVVKATVCVKAPMGPNRQGCASGVSIDPKLVGRDVAQGAVVLTNYHVIAGMGNRPPLQLGGKGEIYRAEILRRSPQYDLALLWVPQVQFPIATLASASPAKGAIVRAIGFPNNQPLTVKDSLLLGKTRTCLAIAPCLALRQGTITFGNSGGPLEADGQIVGINQGEIADEIAIPVEQIREFLAGKNPPASRSPQFDPDFGSGDLRDRPPQFDPELPGRQPPDFLPGAPPPGYPVW